MDINEIIKQVTAEVCASLGSGAAAPAGGDLAPASLAKYIDHTLLKASATENDIRRICDEHHAVLIEDAAESFGATYKGKQTGSFGHLNVISFNGNKIITGSSGGMFLTNSHEDANKVRKWSTKSR